MCLGVFLIGNLSPIMVHVTDKPENESNPALQLVRFIAQLFNAIFPSLDAFDMGPAIIRDTPLSTLSFLGFVAPSCCMRCCARPSASCPACPV